MHAEALPSWWPANAAATETVQSLVSTTGIINKEINTKLNTKFVQLVSNFKDPNKAVQIFNNFNYLINHFHYKFQKISEYN
jgi:hypothetical protein